MFLRPYKILLFSIGLYVVLYLWLAISEGQKGNYVLFLVSMLFTVVMGHVMVRSEKPNLILVPLFALISIICLSFLVNGYSFFGFEVIVSLLWIYTAIGLLKVLEDKSLLTIRSKGARFLIMGFLLLFVVFSDYFVNLFITIFSNFYGR